MPRTLAAVFAAALSVGGCARSDADSDGAPATRDSAGVAIIDYSQTTVGAPRWPLDSIPVHVPRGGGRELFRVRSIVRFDDGRLAVANSGSNEILWFDSTGAYLRTSGGAGEGPGEFRGLAALTVIPPDSLLAWDSSLRRFQVFAGDGSYARAFELSIPGEGPSFPDVLNVTADGEILVRDFRADPEPDRPGVVETTFEIFSYDRAGGFVDSVASAPAWLAFNGLANGIRFSGMTIPFALNSALAATGGELIVANLQAGEIRGFDLDGRLRRIVRLAAAARAGVTSEDVDRYVEAAVGRAPPPAVQQLRAAYASMPIPETKPLLQTVEASDDGQLWVVGWPRSPGAATPVTVLDDGWRIAGVLELPAEFVVHVISGERVAGVWTDAMGVEEGRVYRVTR